MAIMLKLAVKNIWQLDSTPAEFAETGLIAESRIYKQFSRN